MNDPTTDRQTKHEIARAQEHERRRARRAHADCQRATLATVTGWDPAAA